MDEGSLLRGLHEYSSSIGIPKKEALLLSSFLHKAYKLLPSGEFSYNEVMRALYLSLSYFHTSDQNEFGTNHGSELRKRLIKHEAQFFKLHQEETKLDTLALKRANRILTLGASIMISQFVFIVGGTYVVFSWDVMEPIAYLMGMTNFTLAFMFYWQSRAEMDLSSLQDILFHKQAKKLYRKKGFDDEAYDRLKSEIERLREHINQTA